MLKKTITYENFNGEEVTEDLYFNISKAELLDKEIGDNFRERIERIKEGSSNRELLDEFKALILMCYGVKSEDGMTFDKSDSVRERFKNTAAFQQLYFEMLTDEKAAINFVNGVVPADLRDKLGEELKNK